MTIKITDNLIYRMIKESIPDDLFDGHLVEHFPKEITLTGDIFKTETQALVNPVNCVGVMEVLD